MNNFSAADCDKCSVSIPWKVLISSDLGMTDVRTGISPAQSLLHLFLLCNLALANHPKAELQLLFICSCSNAALQ